MNESVSIEITPDKMIAVISFKEVSEEEGLLSLADIKQLIKAKGIVYGIDEAVLEDIIINRKPNFKYIIAKGTMPTKGVDAIHKFYFDEKGLNRIKPKENTDGTVDFKDLSIIHNVTKGQVLYEKIPARRGEAGKNILGQDIASPLGKDIRLPKGKNTSVLEDGHTLVADIDGKLCYDNHNIYIVPLLIIEKDVDSSTGNIDFVGSVLINGSVKNGFSVKAKGNIEIHGSVEAAHIEATEDVLIWYGFQGMDKGSIKAKGNVTAKFIQNAIVEADGNLTAEAIMHSQVAADNIYVDKGKGLIVGGTVVAMNCISAYTIGSSMATQTSIHIGVPGHIMNEYKEVGEAYLKIKEEMEKVNQSIQFLMSKKAHGQLPPDKAGVLRKLLTTKAELSGKKKGLSQRYAELEGTIQNATSGIIKVKHNLYPCVRITMGNTVKYIKEKHTYCSVQKDRADIIIGHY